MAVPLSQPSFQKHPQKVVLIGDSLVYGFGDAEGGGWAERLRRRWMDPDTPGPILYNLGVRGDTVEQVLHRLENEFRLRGELRRQLPDRLVLSVGLNDTARIGRASGRLMTDEASFRLQIAALLDRARRLCPVYFIGMVPVNESAMPYADTLYFSRLDQARYKEITRQACTDRNIPYLDIYHRWASHGESWCNARLCRDGIHPNALGHRTLLNEIVSWQPVTEALC
ncbi:MAG: GDSL-type esterase/lipase family protein [Cyanobacteria bacterium J06628_6]